jgi:hypothetical protein
MPRKNFGEFMKFLPKGLKPFKIQTEFKLVFFPAFFNSDAIGNLNFFPKGKLSLLKLSTTWESSKKFGEWEYNFCIYQNWSS